MVYIDIDGPVINFIGTAKKFGIELEINVFEKWRWKDCEYCNNNAYDDCRLPNHCNSILPETFYAKAELQPWAWDLIDTCQMKNPVALLTKDYAEIKQRAIERILGVSLDFWDWDDIIEAPDKSAHCHGSEDILIDDKPANCEAWRAKGGKAHWFNLASDNPFGDFLRAWNLEGAK